MARLWTVVESMSALVSTCPLRSKNKSSLSLKTWPLCRSSGSLCLLTFESAFLTRCTSLATSFGTVEIWLFVSCEFRLAGKDEGWCLLSLFDQARSLLMCEDAVVLSRKTVINFDESARTATFDQYGVALSCIEDAVNALSSKNKRIIYSGRAPPLVTRD